MELWSHQRRAVEIAASRNAYALFHDMGTGKTLTALHILHRWGYNYNLVVSPKGVIPVWESQIQTYMRGKFAVVTPRGSVAQKVKQLQQTRLTPQTIILLNYDIIYRPEIEAHLKKYPPDVIVADESHRIKGAGSKTSRALSRIGQRAKKRLCLTGTPCPHSPLDIYAQYRFLAPEIFGTSLRGFRSRYCVMGGYLDKQIVKWIRQDELNRKIYSIADRVRSEDVQDLPQTLDVEIEFDLNAKARRAYDQLNKDLVTYIQGERVAAHHVLTKLLRLQQLTGGWLQPDEANQPVQVDTGKLEALGDILLGTTEPVVVFCVYHAEMDGILQWCDREKIPTAEISGRKNEKPKWDRGEARVAVVQIRAGSEGISLVEARYCVFYSTGFGLGAIQQARKRVHRPGQSRPVTYYHLIARGTIDRLIRRATEKRADIVKKLIENKSLDI